MGVPQGTYRRGKQNKANYQVKVNRGDGILKCMVIAFPLIFFGNMVEYFSVTKKNLKKVDGKVSEVIHKTYKCNEGRRGKFSGIGICEKTIIELENIKELFSCFGLCRKRTIHRRNTKRR